MSAKTMQDHFVEALLYALDEAFENVHGMFLDKGTSLFETLATLTAEEASRPVSSTCASLAAQVEHIRFYLDLAIEFVEGRNPGKVDWNHIWQTVREVTPDEWAASQTRLRATYAKVVEMVKAYPAASWEDARALGGAMNMVIHTAYHLGEIRQALCTLKS